MTHKWIAQNRKDKLIVFFNGWGMDENPFSHLTVSEYDVIMFYDYRDLHFSLDKSAFFSYKEIILLGFSMGVWMVPYFQDYFPESNRVAISVNGTLKPIDDQFGIPVLIYDRTMEGLTEQGLEKFFRKMFSGKEEIERFSQNKPRRDFISRKEELSKIREHVFSHELSNPMPFKIAFIGENDRIIPTQSQANFWNQKQVPLKMLPGGHFSFYQWKSYEELIQEALLDR